MTVKKMSVNVPKTSKKSRLPVSSFLPRIAIYSGVMAGIIASFYDFQLNTIVPPSSPSKVDIFSLEARGFIAKINKGQQAYYAEYGQFSDSIAKLGIGIKEQTKNNNYTIVSSMGPVQTRRNRREPAQFESAIAIATFTDSNPGKSDTKDVVFAYQKGAVFAYKEKGSNLIKTISAICYSNGVNASYAETWSPPTFDGKEIDCQH
ncbi:type IV pilin-like G/H family protein [Microcoleus sp. A2-C5]|uniref:type IV pilin-like G/H family protein n=1 Tax=unclassified Microcoleus TaxID=2642155 RepID=UPI002FD1E9CE